MAQQQIRDRSAASGFPLLELMVAVVMLGILVALASPSYKAMIANNRGRSHANALIQVLTSARAEAIKNNRRVVVCKSNDGATCDNSLTWDQGILTFVDNNENGALDTGEAILRTDVPFVTGSVVDSSVNSVRYSSSGLGTPNGTFTITPLGGTGTQIKTVLLSLGRARVRQ